MDSWILEGLNYVILRTTVTGYLYFMVIMFALALIGIILWYRRAHLAHRMILSFFERSLSDNEDFEQRFQLMSVFNQWYEQLTPLKKKIIYRELKEACHHYFDQILQLQKSGEMLLPDVYDFFLEDQLVHKYGKRKLVEAAPGLFVSIGILETLTSLTGNYLRRCNICNPVFK